MEYGLASPEAYIVPTDFGADLPNNFFARAPTDPSAIAEAVKGYRLISLLEIVDMLGRLPPASLR